MPRRKRLPTKSSNEKDDSTLTKRRKLRNVTRSLSFQVFVSTDKFPAKLGCFYIKLQDVYGIAIDNVNVELEYDSLNCRLSWMEKDENNETQEKSCGGICEIPYDVLHGLVILKSFIFVIHSNALHTDLIITVHLNLETFISLSGPSEPFFNQRKESMYKILQYFLKLEFEEYEENILFDKEQITKIYDSLCNHFDPENRRDLVSHNSLIPSLRLYQSQAVQWMLNREKVSSKAKQTGQHVLYTTVQFADRSEGYFHKYGGFFVKEKYAPELPCKGGILADEMGLGKTLEVLACILLNPRNHIEEGLSKIQYSDKDGNDVYDDKDLDSVLDMEPKVSSSENDKDMELLEEYDSDGSYYDYTEINCVCRRSFDYCGLKRIVSCKLCGICQHVECIFYNFNSSSDGYTCPYCLLKTMELPVKSRATLIVSPSSIINQWENEISKHLKPNSLKVFMYLGIEHQRFVCPSELADNDIVLASYETLKKELYHVNLPQGGTEHALRHPKKFITIPCPLSTIEWWRVCLDEAQMVESVTSKISKMAAELHSVNRWCVTGTPIQKSVEDFYGLLLFLGISPYCERLWWKEVIWKPFINGNASYLISVLNEYVWRTSKDKVMDQMGLSAAEEVVYKREFSPVEAVFYKKQFEKYKNDLVKNLKRYGIYQSGEELSSLDKGTLSKVLLPLRKLQQVCCHFQILSGTFMDVQKKQMKTAELLTHLLNIGKYECEEALRKAVMALNGLGGLHYVKRDFQSAADTYIKALNLIENYASHVRADVTQKIHASFHLSNIILNNRDDIIVDVKYTTYQLRKNIEELTSSYLGKQKLAIQLSKNNIHASNKKVTEILSQFKLVRKEFFASSWWIHICECLTDEQVETFLTKLNDILLHAPGQSFLRRDRLGLIWMRKVHFTTMMFNKSKDLYKSRLNLQNKLEKLSAGEPTLSVVESAAACHLRPSANEKIRTKCVYCEAEDAFKDYECKLFRFDENAEATAEGADDASECADETSEYADSTSECADGILGNAEPVPESAETSSENTDAPILYGVLRRGTHADSDYEFILKYLLNYFRRRNEFQACIQDGQLELKLLELLKKEFKNLRALWLKCNEYVSSLDEIEMAKISTRLLLPGELYPSPPVSYIIHPYEVQPKMMQYMSEAVEFEHQLKRKLGQLFYLQNLERAENKNAPFSETCPICQQKIGNAWSVLQCGHCFCLCCIQDMFERTQNMGNNPNSEGARVKATRCPVCRELTAMSDIYCIDNNNKDDDIIKGAYSTKVTAIVKCLLDIKKLDSKAKALVFSSFTDFLCVLERALQENGISCLNTSNRRTFKARLEIFKEHADVNVLLIPLNFGCNGLNIIEASHILLVEPVFDDSKHQQAIGRAHRIGQNKTVMVHKFVIPQTIEEVIYDIMNSSSRKIKGRSELTFEDLKKIFKLKVNDNSSP